MATITLTIPDTQLQTVIDAYKVVHNYQETVLDENDEPIANPETPAQFTKRMVGAQIRGVVQEYNLRPKNAVARQEASDEAEAIEIM